jgi:hypothetical protein
LNARPDFSLNLVLKYVTCHKFAYPVPNDCEKPDCSEPHHKEPSQGLHRQAVFTWHLYNPLTPCRRCDSTPTKQCA